MSGKNEPFNNSRKVILNVEFGRVTLRALFSNDPFSSLLLIFRLFSSKAIVRPSACSVPSREDASFCSRLFLTPSLFNAKLTAGMAAAREIKANRIQKKVVFKNFFKGKKRYSEFVLSCCFPGSYIYKMVSIIGMKVNKKEYLMNLHGFIPLTLHVNTKLIMLF